MFAHHAHHERARGTVYTRTCPRHHRCTISAASTFPTDSKRPSPPLLPPRPSPPKGYAFPVPRSCNSPFHSIYPYRLDDTEQEESFLAFFSLLRIRIYYAFPRFLISIKRNFIQRFLSTGGYRGISFRRIIERGGNRSGRKRSFFFHGSFRAIFPRGSRFRSGCKLAAWRRSEICKSGEKHVPRGRNKIEAKETEFLEFLSPFFSSFSRRSIVLGIFGRRNNHYKTFGRDRDGPPKRSPNYGSLYLYRHLKKIPLPVRFYVVMSSLNSLKTNDVPRG